MSKLIAQTSIVAIVVIVAVVLFVGMQTSPTGLAVSKVSAQVNKGHSNAAVSIPAHAVEVAPNVFDLGFARDVDGRIVQGYMFVFKRDRHAKPPWAGGGGKGGSTKCYAYLAKDAFWQVAEPWIVNPANTEGLDPAFIVNNLHADIQKWEDVANNDILGSGTSTTNVLSVDSASPDGMNEVYFGDAANAGVIAVTTIWGVFGGPPDQRVLVEWDMLFDQADFDWSSTGAPGRMDFENIATHEIGHAVGMGHPENTCTLETMYAYASTGEIIKRDLYNGDKAGIRKAY